MNSEKPKRRFWQIHLSTAAILMIVASVMIGFFNEVLKIKNNTNEIPNSYYAIFKAILIVVALAILMLIGHVSDLSSAAARLNVMNEPKRRRWFQLHLSTVIALALTAGALLYLNLLPVNISRYDVGLQAFQNHQNMAIDWFGWPLPVSQRITWPKDLKEKNGTPANNVYFSEPSVTAILLNAATALLLVYTVFRTCEHYARRRACRGVSDGK